MDETQFTDDEILTWLDEQLPVDRMSLLEQELRNSKSLRQRVAGLIEKRDQGVHSVGEIWRRNRVSCPSRKQLGSYLLDAVDTNVADYIRFHIETVGCRYCAANLEDLKEEIAAKTDDVKQRRQKFFQSSAGYLRKSN